MYKFLPFRFHSFDSQYFLSNETGEFIFIDKEEFNLLVTKQLSVNSKLFLDLISKFFIVEPLNFDVAIQLLAVKYRTKKSFILNFTSLHMIVPTLQCNSKCLYCQVSSKESASNRYVMSFKTAKKIIKLIFQSHSINIKIEFQGGEPLLQFDLIKKIILYSIRKNKFHNKNLEFIICTNLTLINDEQLQFIKKHPIYISTSLDGPDYIHNKNRPLRNGKSSYDLFINKLNLTRKTIGHNRVSALLTVTKFSLSHYEELIKSYISNRFHSIFLRGLNPFGLAVENKKELGYSVDAFLDFYKKSLLYIIQVNINGYFLIEEYASIILSKILTPFSTGFVDLQSPAGLGLSCALYNYDGKIYASDEGRMLAETGDSSFTIGAVNDKYEEIFNGKVIRNLVENSIAEVLPECNSCPYVPFCGVEPVKNYTEQNDLIGNRTTSNSCKKNKYIITLLLKIIKENDPKIMNVFWSWITRRNLKQVEL